MVTVNIFNGDIIPLEVKLINPASLEIYSSVRVELSAKAQRISIPRSHKMMVSTMRTAFTSAYVQ
jgi:hypothetical protein